MTGTTAHRVATLWRMTWEGNALACSVYRAGDRLRLQVESPTAVVITETFDLQPRVLGRARLLREALKRRGWQDISQDPSDQVTRDTDDATPT